jgi:hypothetical protein
MMVVACINGFPELPCASGIFRLVADAMIF